MSVEPSEFVLQYGPWSVSKADTARNCPLRFKYQYIDKVKNMVSPKAGDALVGKAVHKLIEYALTTGRPAERFKDTVMGEYGLEGENVERFLTLIPSAESLLKRLAFYQTAWKALPPKIEQKIAVDLDGKAVSFFDNSKAFFRGVLDMSYYLPEKKHMIVLDHKTGKYRGVGYYQSQFDGYRWLVKGLNPELEGVQVAVNFIQTNQTEFAPFTFVHDAGELRDRVVEFLNKATAKVVDLSAPKRGPLCPWCDFHSICPAQNADGIHGEENSGT